MIFTTYTGNAMLNNALMTVEALGNLNNVSEITPELLLSLDAKHDLKSLYKRLKNYTMLFTKNGPLHNDATNGVRIYSGLFNQIVKTAEYSGTKTCEVSGLKFNTTFQEIYISVLKDIGFSDRDIEKKDTTLNRNWFPLIGGLGSDAQALPQAKHSIQIHPICVVIMQFLPLSSLLYKGRILLIDSSNFEFARRFIAENVRQIQNRIETTTVTGPIDNVKDFSKGNYLLQAIQILEDKELEDAYSDLNLWSFSNSGTGASCEIERVPNSLLKKLVNLKAMATINQELISILLNPISSFKFLESLEYNTEWNGLYPNVFGEGKKKIEYAGVSVAFLEAFFKEIGSRQKIEYARYLAYLISKYKSETFEKYLSKTDAWKERDYRIDLYSVLVEATRNEEWDLSHHCDILDSDQLPVKNFFYNVHKITHFYYLKKAFSSRIPSAINEISQTRRVCEWLISIIQLDERKDKIARDLTNRQTYFSVSYHNLFVRSAKLPSIKLETILQTLYDEDVKLSSFHLNELLRMFFTQNKQPFYGYTGIELTTEWALGTAFRTWQVKMLEFTENYQVYYFDKYQNKKTGQKPYGKFLAQINDIPIESRRFINWLDELITNINAYIWDRDEVLREKWSMDDILCNPLGEPSLELTRFAISFLLHKRYYFTIINESQLTNN